MKNKMKHYRQGDVLLERVSALPKGAVEQKVKGPVILAYGEATGHHHAIKEKSVRIFREPETQATYVEVAEALALLEHQEHAPIELEPGIYKVGLQREYHPQEIRRVAD